MHMFRSTVFPFAFGLLLLSLSACTPTYPKCESDDHCSEKGEVCVANFCKQCRDDGQCSIPGQYCSSNQCTYRLDYCDESRPCTGDKKCRDNTCGPECLENSECSANEFCDGGSCAVKPQCGPNADQPECAAGFACESGVCIQRLTECRPSEPVYFDFDQSKIKRSETSKLDEVAGCLKGENVARAVIEGHADDFGDEQYNLALGERRAVAVQEYLKRVGVSEGLMSTISYGEDRPAVGGTGRQPKNRRVEFSSR